MRLVDAANDWDRAGRRSTPGRHRRAKTTAADARRWTGSLLADRHPDSVVAESARPRGQCSLDACAAWRFTGGIVWLLRSVARQHGRHRVAIRSVDAFRLALGDPNNGNAPGPLPSGRREINWDGGGDSPPTPPRGPRSPGSRTSAAPVHHARDRPSSGAPPSRRPQGGLATFFNNPTYGTIFTTFSPTPAVYADRQQYYRRTFSFPGTGGTSPAGGQRLRRRLRGRGPGEHHNYRVLRSQRRTLGTFSVPFTFTITVLFVPGSCSLTPGR